MRQPPDFEDSFVRDTWACFGARRKSIRHRSVHLRVEWSDDASEAEWFEYEVTFTPFCLCVVIHDLPGVDVEVTALHEPNAGRKLVRIHDMRVFPNPEPLRDALEDSIPVLASGRRDDVAARDVSTILRHRVFGFIEWPAPRGPAG